ncbi:hypothetical protein [Streptomyces vinaceus]|uniref:hypothetical protein n=1 Tax=Streptomyces vinaceus TaxID=1960 RepID=UPI0035DB0E71
MQALVLLADSGDLNNAARHMKHYLDNTGTPTEVDKMLTDKRGFQAHLDRLFLQRNEKAWREQALAEYDRYGGRPVVLPIETPHERYYFRDATDPNGYYAVGGSQTNPTGVVTVTPGADGKPVVGLDYRPRWRAEPAAQGRAGPEFNMAGSSSVKRFGLGDGAAAPAPAEPGRAGERSDPGRHARKEGDVDR